MEYENEYLEMIADTSDLVAQKRATDLGNTVNVFHQGRKFANDVEFWRWMGRNFPNDLVNTQQIQQSAVEKTRWLNTQLQGKGYEWDYMSMQRMNPRKALSLFEAGDCPTQPGIDIAEMGVLDGKVKATYQNKAYLSTNNPNLSNTPKDAIVVTNKEKIAYAEKKGYITEEYMDAEQIAEIRDARYYEAIKGKATPLYNVKNVAAVSAKAGVIGAVIGMTSETVILHGAWKRGELSDDEYLKEIFKAGGDAGITAGVTTAIMVPVQAAITVAGASSLIAIPIAFVLGKAVNSVIAPCFGRGKYKEILGEAKYYQSMERLYDDFIFTAEQSAEQFLLYVETMKLQKQKYETLKAVSKNVDTYLEKLYKTI